MLIHCDEELIRQFGRTQVELANRDQDRFSAILGNWHASVIKVLGSQFLMYVHTKSLYSTLDFLDSPGTPIMMQTVHNLRGKILEMLNDHYCLTDYQEKCVIQPFKDVSFGLINNKRMSRIVQGIILAYQKRFIQARQSSPHGEVRLWELEDDLNNTVRRNLGDCSPAEILRQLIWSGIN
jgi:hypothetical protein